MSQWRKDPVVNRWVVISTERSKRPKDYKHLQETRLMTSCPLCMGREEETPPEIIAYREYGTIKDTPGWWVRVVPNKFPAVRVEMDFENYTEGINFQMNGVGAHEVIVETSEHTDNIDDQTDWQVEEIIRIWLDRARDLRKDERLKYIQIFKNYGATAGASLQHTHSQLIAIPMVPSNIQEELDGTLKYSKETGRCVYCDMIAQEINAKSRVVMENDNFLCFTPFASRFPFEICIIPKEHQSDFGWMRDNQVLDLAKVLRVILRKLSIGVSNPPYNMVIHTAPVNSGNFDYYHWHIELLPRLTIMAGFELGTGFYINPTSPEIAAEDLRLTEDFRRVHDNTVQEVLRYV